MSLLFRWLTFTSLSGASNKIFLLIYIFKDWSCEIMNEKQNKFLSQHSIPKLDMRRLGYKCFTNWNMDNIVSLKTCKDLLKNKWIDKRRRKFKKNKSYNCTNQNLVELGWTKIEKYSQKMAIMDKNRSHN